MIFCIDLSMLKAQKEVQRLANIEELILHHTKMYESIEKAAEDNYAPLTIAVSVRSLYDNTVLVLSDTETVYNAISDISVTPHKGADLILYYTSIGFMNFIDTTKLDSGFDNLMLNDSKYSLIGVYNVHPDFINPMVYSHIVMTDEGMKKLKTYLKDNVEVMTIKQAKEKYGNVANNALLDTFISIEKRGEQNE